MKVGGMGMVGVGGWELTVSGVKIFRISSSLGTTFPGFNLHHPKQPNALKKTKKKNTKNMEKDTYLNYHPSYRSAPYRAIGDGRQIQVVLESILLLLGTRCVCLSLRDGMRETVRKTRCLSIMKCTDDRRSSTMNAIYILA
jgi:hypothetical protein